MPALLQAWQAIGLPGSTMLEGAGAYRTATRLSRAGLGAGDRLFEDVPSTGHGLRVAAIPIDLE